MNQRRCRFREHASFHLLLLRGKNTHKKHHDNHERVFGIELKKASYPLKHKLKHAKSDHIHAISMPPVPCPEAPASSSSSSSGPLEAPTPVASKRRRALRGASLRRVDDELLETQATCMQPGFQGFQELFIRKP